MIKTWIAFLVYSSLMISGYVWATFYSSAPYLAFASQFTIGFAAYSAKRVIQKHKSFNGKVPKDD